MVRDNHNFSLPPPLHLWKKAVWWIDILLTVILVKLFLKSIIQVIVKETFESESKWK